MKRLKVVFGLAFTMSFLFNLNGAIAAEGEYSARIRDLFSQGQLPELRDGQIKWFCGYESDGRLRSGSNYGFQEKDGDLWVEHFGRIGLTQLQSQENALVAKDTFEVSRDRSADSFLAIRALNTTKGRRLIIEESMSLESPRVTATSTITGHPANLYLICIPVDELLPQKL